MLSHSAYADALITSLHVQDAASKEGFDWPDVSGVLDKVEEEVGEIRQALASGDSSHARKELGDLLLISVNLARFLGADPREELLNATARFSNRFVFLKKALAGEEKCIAECTLEELEIGWQRIKHEADKVLSTGLDMGRIHGANSGPDFIKNP
jgi:ATP diphosphatase